MITEQGHQTELMPRWHVKASGACLSMLDLLQQSGNPLHFVVDYGSGENDWDLLAVYENPPPRNEIIIGRLDLLALGQEALLHMIRHLDPSVTEPLLTGRLVAGDESAFLAARDSLRARAPDWSAVRHLLRSGQAAYGNALACLHSASPDAPDTFARPFWGNLSWALTFQEFAQYYAARLGEVNAVVQLRSLVEQMRSPVRELWGHILEPKTTGTVSGAEQALQTFERTVLLACGQTE